VKSRSVSRIVVLLCLVGPADSAWPQAQKKSAPAQAKPKAQLSEQEKEIVKHRDLLENLELLKELEKIRYLDFLASGKAGRDKGNSSEMQPVKSDAQKNR
jgi:hypothetical protein